MTLHYWIKDSSPYCMCSIPMLRRFFSMTRWQTVALCSVQSISLSLTREISLPHNPHCVLFCLFVRSVIIDTITILLSP